MYILFSIIFIFICITLITLIIFYNNETNIIGLHTNNKNNNIIITSNLIKNIINNIIIIVAILFYIICILLNLLNNIEINNINKKINNIKILK